jgi:hypothetical protein
MEMSGRDFMDNRLGLWLEVMIARCVTGRAPNYSTSLKTPVGGNYPDAAAFLLFIPPRVTTLFPNRNQAVNRDWENYEDPI